MRAAKLQATAAQNDLEKAQRDLSTVRVEIRKHERVRERTRRSVAGWPVASASYCSAGTARSHPLLPTTASLPLKACPALASRRSTGSRRRSS